MRRWQKGRLPRLRRMRGTATLRTTLEPTIALLREKSTAAGRETKIEESLCDGAFEAVLAGNTASHDRIVSQALTELAAKVDLVVLAQASMARVLQAMPEGTVTVPVCPAQSWRYCERATFCMALRGMGSPPPEIRILFPVKKRHGVLALLGAVSIITFLDRLAIAVTGLSVQHELRLHQWSGDGC